MKTNWQLFMQEIATGAGAILMKHFQKIHRIEKKPGAGIVTEADKNAEAYLLNKISRKYPNSSIITEESGEFRRDPGLMWVIDPLDGTTNYAHGFPWFCVSIGLWEDEKPRAGIVYNPVNKELFYAEAGKGATKNGKKIRVSSVKTLPDALLGTGFYYTRGDRLSAEMHIFSRVQEVALGVRRPGSAALDLAYVASGRYEGFWERGLSSWDVAAGIVLVQEAGGKISDYVGKPTNLFRQEIVASNGKVHKDLIGLISD